jgi:hypothetical protein
MRTQVVCRIESEEQRMPSELEAVQKTLVTYLDGLYEGDTKKLATAFHEEIKLECSIHPRYFTDYLTLLKFADGWRIVSKTFRTDTR